MAISANEILDGLDDAQRRAACSVDGPVRIIACAGAGKTRTITRRIAYACASGAWEASRALAVTFSVKAAQEMRTRLLDLGVGEDMHIATFHAAALHQLRTMWPDVCEGPFPVLSESPRDLVGAALFRALNMQPERNVVQDVHAEIDWCKVSLIAPEDYVRVCEATHHAPPAPLDPQSFTRVYDQYEQEKAARMEIDFNDILLVTAHILDTYPEVGEQVRAHIGWLTVDEYQDVSPLQHRLMRSWLGAHRNVCVVGDPAQTIYSFAGATSYYLNHFAREFHPLAADIALDTDYRSAQSIVARANTVLGVGQIGHVFGVGDADHAVGADAEVPVTHMRDLLRLRVIGTMVVGEHEKIVAGRLCFGQSLCNSHAFTVLARVPHGWPLCPRRAMPPRHIMALDAMPHGHTERTA